MGRMTPVRLCGCMTEDPGDGSGERVVTHSMTCPLHPEHDPAAATAAGAAPSEETA